MLIGIENKKKSRAANGPLLNERRIDDGIDGRARQNRRRANIVLTVVTNRRKQSTADSRCEEEQNQKSEGKSRFTEDGRAEQPDSPKACFEEEQRLKSEEKYGKRLT